MNKIKKKNTQNRYMQIHFLLFFARVSMPIHFSNQHAILTVFLFCFVSDKTEKKISLHALFTSFHFHRWQNENARITNKAASELHRIVC